MPQFTLDEVLTAAEHVLCFEDWKHEIGAINMTREHFGMVEGQTVALVLEHMGVEDAHERIDWYNVLRMSAGEVRDLANLDFTLGTCDHCGESVAQVHTDKPTRWPGCDFIGLSLITVPELGISVDLCEDCIGKLRAWF